MLSLKRKPFENSQDLLKIYRMAYEKAKYVKDFDEKILAFNDVINYCADSKLCVEDDSKKRNQVLFWTYNNIGDVFVEKNTKELNDENYFYALQYYNNALEFLSSDENKKSVLEKIAFIYGELQDDMSRQKTLEQIVMVEPDSMKRQAFVELAKVTDDVKLQAKYLENALNYVTYENVSVLEKCKNTLDICAWLLEIYEHIPKSNSDYERIKTLQKNTISLLD